MPGDMGILRTDVEIQSPLREGDRRLLRDVLVDTGAELSWAPAAVLESLGITRRKSVRFQQADGTILERWVGFAIVHAAGTFTTSDARDYTVKVDATGLYPGLSYFYRFKALGVSPSTRCVSVQISRPVRRTDQESSSRPRVTASRRRTRCTSP